MAVNIRIKSKIRYNGQEYSSPRDLPVAVRAAYDKALRNSAAVTTQRIVINGQEFSGENNMPAGQKRLYDDVLALIQDNGAVTLPEGHQSESWLTAGQTRLVILVASLLGLAALVMLSR